MLDLLRTSLSIIKELNVKEIYINMTEIPRVYFIIDDLNESKRNYIRWRDLVLSFHFIGAEACYGDLASFKRGCWEKWEEYKWDSKTA